MIDACTSCGHAHFSRSGTVKWNPAALQCPEYIRLCLELWDDGIHLGVATYKPQTLRQGRCHLKERGVCVWQRDPDAEGIVRCASPDLKPALWSMDRDPMSFFLQECPACRRRYVFSHANRLCPNKKCPNRRPWALRLVEECRYYRRPERVPRPVNVKKAAAPPKKTAPVSVGTMRKQFSRPRVAVYRELRAVMLELAAAEGGFAVDDHTMARLAAIAARRSMVRRERIVRAQQLAAGLPG